MKNALFLLLLSIAIFGCNTDGGDPAELPQAFNSFDADNTDIYVDGDEVVIETNGLPNHTSPYWSDNHPLYVDRNDDDHHGACTRSHR